MFDSIFLWTITQEDNSFACYCPEVVVIIYEIWVVRQANHFSNGGYLMGVDNSFVLSLLSIRRILSHTSYFLSKPPHVIIKNNKTICIIISVVTRIPNVCFLSLLNEFVSVTFRPTLINILLKTSSRFL